MSPLPVRVTVGAGADPMLLNKFSQTVAEAAESSKISTPDAKKRIAALLEKAEQLKDMQERRQSRQTRRMRALQQVAGVRGV